MYERPKRCHDVKNRENEIKQSNQGAECCIIVVFAIIVVKLKSIHVSYTR